MVAREGEKKGSGNNCDIFLSNITTSHLEALRGTGGTGCILMRSKMRHVIKL